MELVLASLAAVGVKEFGSYIFRDIFLPLVEGSLEDYTKDTFKGWIADVVGLVQKDSVQGATVKGLKFFLDLFKLELEGWSVSEEDLTQIYKPSLKTFIYHQEVKPLLGEVFKLEGQRLNGHDLEAIWQDLGLAELPEDFDWAGICKKYLKKVEKELMADSSELREILQLQYQQDMRDDLKALVGVPVDFDLDKYQEALRERYGRLKFWGSSK